MHFARFSKYCFYEEFLPNLFCKFQCKVGCEGGLLKVEQPSGTTEFNCRQESDVLFYYMVFFTGCIRV